MNGKQPDIGVDTKFGANTPVKEFGVVLRFYEGCSDLTDYQLFVERLQKSILSS